MAMPWKSYIVWTPDHRAPDLRDAKEPNADVFGLRPIVMAAIFAHLCFEDWLLKFLLEVEDVFRTNSHELTRLMYKFGDISMFRRIRLSMN